MKNLALILLATLVSCSYVSPPPAVISTDNNKAFLEKVSKDMEVLGLVSMELNAVGGEKYGPKVDLYNEMLELFNPDKLNCNLSDRLKTRLKESKRETKDKDGYVPDLVVNNISQYKEVIKVGDRGANILLHYFTFQKTDGSESDPIISKETPTQKNFKLTSHIDNQAEGYESFYFTMDCSGFFSASAKVAFSGGFLGIGKASLAAEGERTINQNQSILVIRALMKSPLYAAYDGSHIFKISESTAVDEKKSILKNRIQTLQGILDAIPTPDQIDDRKVYLNANYEAVITSNKGNYGFNGNGSINSNVDVNFVSIQGSMETKNSVSRKAEFSNFDSYILKANMDVQVDDVTVKKIKDRIAELSTLLSQI